MSSVVKLPIDPWELRVRQSAARLLAREPRLRAKLLRTDVNRVYAHALVDRRMGIEEAELEASRFHRAVLDNLAFHGCNLQVEPAAAGRDRMHGTAARR